MATLTRFLILLLLGVATVRACDCLEPTVSQAKKRAEIVFRGRIAGFQNAGQRENVIFAVDRVWKGKVPQTFEMAAIREGAACLGFWPTFLKVGNYLIVYAYRLDKSADYVTDICSRTSLVDNSKDFAKLGSGHQPSKE